MSRVTKAGARAAALLLLGGAGCVQDAANGPELPGDVPLTELTALELQARLTDGSISAEQVTRAFLERIAALDDQGPELGAIIGVNPDSLAIAAELDREYARRGPVGPLHGIPVVLKASIDTADRMPTSAGSLALADHYAAADAELVGRLRAAGAVLLAKANLSEWANFRSLHSTSGWSSVGGQTRNPYVLDRNPCGSSSGSAVAVAARLAPLAVGTETDGSIVCPAGVNGVVGIKPGIGTVSQHGLIPIAHSQDVAGPFARTVADAALLLGAMDSVDGSYEVRSTGVRGLRIGVVRDYAGAGANAAVEQAFSDSLRLLTAAGAELVDPVRVGMAPEISAAELELLLYEFKNGIDAYLSARQSAPRSLAELIDYNERNAANVLTHFGQDLFVEAERRGSLDEPAYAAAVEGATRRVRVALASLFDTQQLDALFAPTSAPAWRTDYAAGDSFSVGSSSFAAVSGYPAISVPAAVAGELPIGVTFVAPPGREAELLEIAAELERLRGPFPAPKFLRSID